MALKDISHYNVSEDALNLNRTLDKILETVNAVFDSYGVPLPSRQYWMTGRPAYDCEQVVVSFIQAYLGVPGGDASQATNCHVPRSAVVQISIVREIAGVGTSGRAPSPQSIQSGSQWAAVDAWVLLESLNQFDAWDEMGGRGPGLIATVNSEDHAGGYEATNMQLTIAIP